MIVVILVLLALTVRGTAGTPTTGADPSAHGDVDVVIRVHEVRSRGPPTSSVQLTRPTAEVPVLSVRPAVHEQSPQCRNAAMPPAGLAPEMLDPTTTIDYNNRSTSIPAEGSAGQITANSVDRRTRESLTVHTVGRCCCQAGLRGPVPPGAISRSRCGLCQRSTRAITLR